MHFKIHRNVIGRMILHALEEDPLECCGVLLGSSDDEATEFIKVKNVADEKERRYSMDPLEQAAAEQRADADGRSITGIFHSHTFTQAYPSATDIKNAVNSMWTGPVYVLVSLVEKTRPVVRAFRISDDGAVTEIVITTDGKPYRS